MLGQDPVNGKCYCEKCKRIIGAETGFYTFKDQSKTKICKQCLTMHIDNWDPDTYLWVLEMMDVPYVPVEWNAIRDKAYAAHPKKMNGLSVIGKYLSKMKLKQWKRYGWKDTELLRKQQEELAQQLVQEAATEEEQKVIESQAAALKEQLESGQITLAQYETLVPTEVLMKEQQQIPTSTNEAYHEAGIDMYNESNFLSEEELPDPAAQLTEEDKVYLAMKWGRLYKPGEWVELEKNYTEMTNSFDIQDADTKNTLILICKTNLKMNQAIDSGDVEGYQKLTRVYDSLRKSAKFTAAQNKEGNSDYVDSIGELVAMCEKEGGFIPRWVVDVPQDKVDYALQDMNKYVYNLVTKDLGFGQQIETYIKKIELEKEAERAMDASEDGLTVNLNDDDIEEYYEDLAEQLDQDNNIIVSPKKEEESKEENNGS